jgi:hypothetical protein
MNDSLSLSLYRRSHIRMDGSTAIMRNISTWPILESATGRARKRRRRGQLLIEKQKQKQQQQQQQQQQQANNATADDSQMKQTWKRRPWEVLFPNPHRDPVVVEAKSKWPTRRSFAQFRNDFSEACNLYRSTWDGDSKPKKTQKEDLQETQNPAKDENEENQLRANVERNLEVAREESSKLLEKAKERTGLQSQADLKAFAADMMKLATECLKEFMSGYRQGRDQEIDRMLHEYFQGDSEEEEEDNGDQSQRKRRRKPKRRILSD